MVAASPDGRGWGAGVEVEFDVELPGDQAAGGELGAQATFHQTLQGEVGVQVGGIADNADTFRLHFDQDRDLELGLVGIELELDIEDAADANAPQFHRGPDGKAAHRTPEIHQVTFALEVDPLMGLLATGVEGEEVTRRCRLPVRLQGVWGVEGDPSDQHRQHGLGIDLEPVGTQREVDPARVPEAGVGVDQGLVGGRDEDPHVDPAAAVVQFVADHLTHGDVAVIDRGPGVEGPQGRRAQGEAATALGGGHQGFLREPDEVAPRLPFDHRVHGDVGPGEQGVEPRDPGGGDARAGDPEAGLLGEVALCPCGQFGGDQHLAQVLGHVDGADLADGDILELDLGLAGDQPGGGGEADVDGRAPLRIGLVGQPAADEQGDQGDQPDQGGPFPGDDLGLRQFVQGRRGQVGHGRWRGSGRCRGLASGLHGVPDQPGVEGHGREQGDDHHGREEDRPDLGLDVGQVTQVDQGHQDGDHVDVHHGPAPHRLGDAVEAGAVAPAPARAHLHRDQEEDQGGELE